ncbi:ArsR/SmtB family transcription factor [Gephyromycinifex aptenodytis]|uniref:ArsR/SmtB family transcription factor n=1 Tax=Gephyromycinifex aptenodytis TaxID=2716227 RepID=UPI0014480414|nr:winged helix-turn-helix domain-containing protein [Gephyromycinifex aptenodytis]
MATEETPAAFPVDRSALRVLAHPLRSRILAELRSVGTATATDLAHALETNSGATSYHLRRLSEAGLVREVGVHGRRRLWEADSSDRTLDAPDDDNDEAALDWLARDYIAHFSTKAQGWLTEQPDWPLPWQETCGLDDHLVLVTAEQLASLRADVAEVLDRYRRVGAGNPQAKRVTFYTCPIPVDPPRRRTEIAP